MRSLLRFVLAVGVGSLALVSARGAGVRAEASAQASDVQPRFVNARLDTRPVASGLGKTFDALVAGDAGAAWVGYSVTAIPGDHVGCNGCGAGECGTVFLEGHRWRSSEAAPAPVSEASKPIAILFRVERASVLKIRVNSFDCELDAGGLPVHWLAGVGGAESIGLLERFVSTARDGRSGTGPSISSVVTAIALHSDPSATRSLEGFVSAGQPPEARKRAAFWLGSTRGQRGFELLRKLAETDTDSAFRREVTFAISVSPEPPAVDVLIGMARNDSSGDVRKQAIFWLGQKAGRKVVGTLADAAASDPETAIKERAVFALSRLPNGEGVEKLIEVARTNRDLAVRKRAIFWLGQSSDPRALDYITQVLKGK